MRFWPSSRSVKKRTSSSQNVKWYIAAGCNKDNPRTRRIPQPVFNLFVVNNGLRQQEHVNIVGIEQNTIATCAIADIVIAAPAANDKDSLSAGPMANAV